MQWVAMNDEQLLVREWMRHDMSGWERLCLWKKDGDMGFWHLHNFNLALLGKLGWELVAELSFVWCSIFSSQHVIKRGYRWHINKDAKVNVWKD